MAESSKKIPIVQKIMITVEAELIWHPDRKKNSMHMSFHDCSAQIVRKMKEVGEVTGAMGGCVDLKDQEIDVTYTIRPLELFRAFQKGLEAANVRRPA